MKEVKRKIIIQKFFKKLKIKKNVKIKGNTKIKK